MLGTTRAGYFGSVIEGCRSQLRTVLRDNPVLRAISRTETLSRKCIRRILANMPTVITPVNPAQIQRRVISSRGSVLDSHQQRVDKAQSKGILNDQTKVAKVRDVLLNDRALSALRRAKALTFLAGGCVFVSQRTGDEFKTEKSQRYVFTRALKKLGIRHRPAYNTRHTYATMLLMAGVNINFVANQLGHSPIMTATTYSKWISGAADRAEMAKLDTAKRATIGGKLAGPEMQIA